MGKHKVAINSNIILGNLEHPVSAAPQNWNNANRKAWATADLNEVLTKLTPISDQLITAIDNELSDTFVKACTAPAVGLSEELAIRVWDATMGSLDPQASRPCW